MKSNFQKKQKNTVKCDSETTNAAAIQAGVVNLIVGVALQATSEFILLQIGLTAG